MDTYATQQNSPAWLTFVKISFFASIGAMAFGIYFMPIELWIKGYLAMGTLMVVNSTFNLAKTLRDEFEMSKLVNRLQEAKTEKMLKEYDGDPASRL